MGAGSKEMARKAQRHGGAERMACPMFLLLSGANDLKE